MDVCQNSIFDNESCCMFGTREIIFHEECVKQQNKSNQDHDRNQCDEHSQESNNFSDKISIYFSEQLNHSILSHEETIELIRKFKQGDIDARNTIVKHNLKLVAREVNKYKKYRISFHDLMQEGFFGLIKAIEKFEEKKGVKFSIYAPFWIRQVIVRAIENQKSTVRVPTYLINIRQTIFRSAKFFKQKEGRLPTVSELAQDLEETEEMIRRALYFGNTASISLDCSVVDMKDGMPFHNFFTNDVFLNPVDCFEAKEIMKGCAKKVREVFEFAQENFCSCDLILFHEAYDLKLSLSGRLRRNTYKKIGEKFELSFEFTREKLRRMWVEIRRSKVNLTETQFLEHFNVINELEKITNTQSGIF